MLFAIVNFKCLKNYTKSECRAPAYSRALSCRLSEWLMIIHYVQWMSETSNEKDLREKTRDRQADKGRQTDTLIQEQGRDRERR